MLVVAGCGSSADVVPDAVPGTELTVKVNAPMGMVVSEPPGIRCGACQTKQTSGKPCPPGPTTDRTCSAVFAPGTAMSLKLVGQDMYSDFLCASEPGGIVTSCEFVFTEAMTIGVWGEVCTR